MRAATFTEVIAADSLGEAPFSTAGRTPARRTEINPVLFHRIVNKKRYVCIIMLRRESRLN